MNATYFELYLSFKTKQRTQLKENIMNRRVKSFMERFGISGRSGSGIYWELLAQ